MPIIAFGEIEDVGRRLGMCLTILASGALAGPPISGAINGATGGFKAVGYYAGLRSAAVKVHASLTHQLQVA
jgi:MFS transporter, MCT family, solute carrier family 16 (monocarboxylic acid transporters), member 10